MSDPTPPPQAERVLVADDHEPTVMGLKRMLAPYYEVDTAMSAVEVMQLYNSRPYFCLVLDVTFEQGMSGLEMAALIRSRDPEIGIIICSGFNYSDDVLEQVAELDASFIEKPVVLDELLEKLRRRQERLI